MKKILLAGITLFPFMLLLGCSIASPIQDAEKSKSYFTEHSYQPVINYDYSSNEKYKSLTKYRIFHQASTGFVSKESIRQSLLKRANDFCKRQDKVVETVSETASTTVFLPGNFPKLEVIFVCIDAPETKSLSKYDELLKLKNLLDNGSLTQKEFDTEKGKLLAK